MPHLLPNDIGPDMFSFVRYLIEWTVLPAGGGGGADPLYYSLLSNTNNSWAPVSRGQKIERYGI